MQRLRSLVLVAAALAAATGSARAQDGGTPSPQGAAAVPAVDTATVDTAAVYDGDDVTTPPALNNREAVVRAMMQNYPEILRNQGISGSADLEVVIDRVGRPERVRVIGATNPEFAQAAQAVVRVMRFKPAAVNGVPVCVRVQLPVMFQLETGRSF